MPDSTSNVADLPTGSEAPEVAVVENVVIPPGIPYPWPSGYYFGDGSGGEYTKYPTLRRAGVGLHYVDPTFKPMYGIWQAMPGQIKTVDRGVLQALLITVANVEIGGTVDFFTDSKITHDAFYKGLGRARFSNSADMWVKVFKYINMSHYIGCLAIPILTLRNLRSPLNG